MFEYTWSVNNLKELKAWIESIKEGKPITVPSMLSFVAISTYQQILKEKQGELLHNGHFTDESLEQAINKLDYKERN